MFFRINYIKNVWWFIMSSCEFVLFISYIACQIADGKTSEEIAILSAFFTQLGDTLGTIDAFN